MAVGLPPKITVPPLQMVGPPALAMGGLVVRETNTLSISLHPWASVTSRTYHPEDETVKRVFPTCKFNSI